MYFDFPMCMLSLILLKSVKANVFIKILNENFNNDLLNVLRNI